MTATTLPRGTAPTRGMLRGLFPRGISRWSWLTLLNTWITWALNAVVFAMVYVIGDVIIKAYGLSPAGWGFVVAGYLLLRVLLDLPITILSDRIGTGWRRKLVWFPLMLLYAIVGTLIAVPALSGTLFGFCLLLAAVAVGTTASEALGVIATSEWWPREHRGFAVGLHHTGYPVGALFGGLFASFVLVHFGEQNWRLVYLASFLTVPFAIWYWFLATRQHEDEVTRHDRAEGLTPSVEDEQERVTLQSCLAMLKRKDILVLAGCAFLFQAMQNVFQTSFPEYLHFVGGVGAAAVASLTVVWTITGAFFQWLWPSVSDRVGRKWFIVGAGVVQGVVYLLLPVATTVVGAVLVQLLYGVTLNAVFPLLFSSAADVSGKRTGSALGVVFSALWLGAACGSLLASEVLQAGGGFANAGAYRTVYYSMVALAAIIIVLRLLVRETHPRAQRGELVAEAPAG